MEKYGFVYIWRDRKYNKYYIGSHWGFDTDKYICSSNNMRDNYRNRKSDFRRRILKRVYTNRKDLLEEEQKFLDMIKPEEFGVKYYNISASTKCQLWWTNETTKKIVSKKISESHRTMEQRTGKKWGYWKIGDTFKHTPEAIEKITIASRKNMTRETKDKISKSSMGKKHTEESKRKMSEVQSKLKVNLGRKHSEETKAKMSKMRIGKKIKPWSDESKLRISLVRVGRVMAPEQREKISIALNGRKKSAEHRKNISKAKKGISLSEKHKQNLKLSYIKRKENNNDH